MQSHPLCPWRMQVHHVVQETPDVWTIALINHDFYRWQAGQFALVQVGKSSQLRAYTLSSTPGQSDFITLTVRHIEGGKGSHWLTQQVKAGDYVWLSDAQGEFTCEQHPADRYLMMAAGCGITPVISMCRWLHAHRPDARVTLCYSVRSEQDVIFADALRAMQPWLALELVVENRPTADLPEGRITRERLKALVPDMTQRTVMICGPAAYMQQVEGFARELGAAEICLEQFTPADSSVTEADAAEHTLRSATKAEVGIFNAGETLLDALEKNQFAVDAACRAGVCGCCKTQILRGEYRTDSTQTLSAEEIAAGYVLACRCHPASDIVIS
ncbi:NADH oxidoreductase [Erwinia sp. 9145]|uniref:NADH oxidoreductase n=1 Tax=Erwinia sp. 9145 TaxID=1500895 RepID=UPI000555B712|nr:NADH oxidoreductase [Erwinia sp. 9145]